jgi:transcriptional regulator
MYTPSAFELDDPLGQQQLINGYPFATLTAHGAQGLFATHIPFLLDLQQGSHGVLQAHIAKNNSEFAGCPDGTPVLVVFQGPSAYISPSWYPTKKSSNGKAVPTWNYVAVHVHGVLCHQGEAAWLMDHLGRMTLRHEQNRPDPWSIKDAPADYIDTMVQHIVGLEIAITRIEGKAKLSQNRPAVDQQGVVHGLNDPLEPIGPGRSGGEVARLMQARLDSK